LTDPVSIFDKNSFWNGLNVTEGGVVRQEEGKITRHAKRLDIPPVSMDQACRNAKRIEGVVHFWILDLALQRLIFFCNFFLDKLTTIIYDG